MCNPCGYGAVDIPCWNDTKNYAGQNDDMPSEYDVRGNI